jgi:hypothetical protein
VPFLLEDDRKATVRDRFPLPQHAQCRPRDMQGCLGGYAEQMGDLNEECVRGAVLFKGTVKLTTNAASRVLPR